MLPVVFVAPFFLDATLRFLSETADLPGVRLGLVCQDPPERLPPRLRGKLAAVRRIPDALDPARIADAVRELGQELGGVARLLGALEQLQVPLAQVRDALGIPGVDAATARNFRDKALMKSVFHEHGVACARHALAHDEGELVRAGEGIGYPIVLKPPAGVGARQTYRFSSPARLREHLNRARLVFPILVEEFLEGEEHSFDSVMRDGELVWHSVSDYLPTPLQVLENPWIQWCVLLPRELDDPRYDPIRQEGTAALRALGLRTGFTHMEWFRRPDGSVAISEVAVRPPGAQFTTLISHAHEFDLYRAWARLLVFDEFDPAPRRYAAGAAYFRGMGRGRVRAVHGLDQAQREFGDLVVEARLPRPGQPASGTYEGEGYAILRHPDTEVVRRALLRTVELVRVELAVDP